MTNQHQMIADNVADAIVVIAETIKRFHSNPHMKKVLVALVMGSGGTSRLKKKDVEFIVDKIYDLDKEYKATEIVKMRNLLK